jgi:hypothetical protein
VVEKLNVMKRVKVSNEYYRSGHNRTTPRKAVVYLIDGFYYAKDSKTAATNFNPLSGSLTGYVRVNHSGGTSPFYYEVSGHSERDQHKPAN